MSNVEYILAARSLEDGKLIIGNRDERIIGRKNISLSPKSLRAWTKHKGLGLGSEEMKFL